MTVEFEIAISNGEYADAANKALEFVKSTESYSSGYTRERFFLADVEYDSLKSQIENSGFDRIVVVDSVEFGVSRYPGFVLSIDRNSQFYDPDKKTLVLGINLETSWSSYGSRGLALEEIGGVRGNPVERGRAVS